MMVKKFFFIFFFSLILPFCYAAEKPAIYIGLTAAFVSQQGVGVYDDIAKYLQKKTGYQVQLVPDLSYNTVNKMLKEGALQLGFVCGYPYTLLYDQKKQDGQPYLHLMVAPVMTGSRYNGQPVYYSDIIVAKDSNIDHFSQLKGKVFVYSDKISNSGYNMPRNRLIEDGLTHGFFAQVIHSGSHEESIRMVAEHKADMSAVDSLVLDYAKKNDEPYANQVKVIGSLGPAPVPPLVYSAKMPLEQVQVIKEALLNMNQDPIGKKILDKALVKKFVPVSNKDYQPIRQWHDNAVKHNFMLIK